MVAALMRFVLLLLQIALFFGALVVLYYMLKYSIYFTCKAIGMDISKDFMSVKRYIRKVRNRKKARQIEAEDI